jgi:tRNA-dihydrouridine synthase B
MQIGPYVLSNNLMVAPMAGVTDRPFRSLCKKLGAGYAVSEMMTSLPQLWATTKSLTRMNHDGEAAPVAVQIAGTEAQQMAEATRFNIGNGAQIVDINMGCPAKKVCNRWAGSALMQDERLAISIVSAVVEAAASHGVPVTLKMRTGWADAHKNVVGLAQQAEAAGVQMVVVHGRTREQGYKGRAEYESIAELKTRLRIPVVANGDIDSPDKALQVLRATGADGLMIGRAAQGRPWLFREINHFLLTGEYLAPPLVAEVQRLLQEHLIEHYDLYGPYMGVRTARKHIGWYVRGLPTGEAFRAKMNLLEDCDEQLKAVDDFFDGLAAQSDHLPAEPVDAALALVN